MLVGSAAMLVALSLSGCFAQETPDATSSPSPSTTPVFASEEEALAAATEAYASYRLVSEAIFADGGSDPERLLTVATEEQYGRELTGYKELASNKLHAVGKSFFEPPTLQMLESSGDNTTIVFYACVDVSNVDIQNAAGESQVRPDRVDRYTTETTVVLHDGRLLVASDIPWTGESLC